MSDGCGGNQIVKVISHNLKDSILTIKTIGPDGSEVNNYYQYTFKKQSIGYYL